MPFTDVRKVLLITTQIPSLARWQICVSLSPAHDPGEKPAMAYFKYKESLEAELTAAVPFVLALILSRFYLRERTCNAGIKLSMCS